MEAVLTVEASCCISGYQTMAKIEEVLPNWKNIFRADVSNIRSIVGKLQTAYGNEAQCVC
jgi:hypothetical protein